MLCKSNLTFGIISLSLYYHPVLLVILSIIYLSIYVFCYETEISNILYIQINEKAKHNC